MVMQQRTLQAKYCKREIAAVRDTGRISERLIYMIAQICIHKWMWKISYLAKVCCSQRQWIAATFSVLSLHEEGHYRVSLRSDSDTCPLIMAAYPCS